MSIDVNKKSLYQLARDILHDLKLIQMLNEEMEQNLKALGTTFIDENYNDVCSYIASAQKKLKEAEPDVVTACTQLVDAADHLVHA